VVRFRVERLRRLAVQALGSDAAAADWLSRPHEGLGGVRPDSMVYTLEEFERAVALLELPDAE
jgi:putative toxin-antitoxin system antitoxin component (TIGR02293 family)